MKEASRRPALLGVAWGARGLLEPPPPVAGHGPLGTGLTVGGRLLPPPDPKDGLRCLNLFADWRVPTRTAPGCLGNLPRGDRTRPAEQPAGRQMLREISLSPPTLCQSWAPYSINTAAKLQTAPCKSPSVQEYVLLRDNSCQHDLFPSMGFCFFLVNSNLYFLVPNPGPREFLKRYHPSSRPGGHG